MKTLIWKEIREYRFHLLLMMLFGIGSVGILSYNRMLDGGTLTMLLLAFSNPVFILLFSQNIVSGEVKSGIFPFLAGLPISRSRLWLAKLASVLLLAAALTSFFAGLIELFGETGVVHSITVTRSLPPMTWLFLLLGLPLAIISLGFFATMLPGAPSVAVMIGTVLVFISFYLSQSIGTLNYLLLVPLLSASFLAASYQAFTRGEFMLGWKSVLIGWGTLGLCVLLSTGVWACLDAAADRLPPREQLESFHFGFKVNGGVQTMLIHTDLSWWDPINTYNASRIVMADPNSGQITQIGPRQSIDGLVSPDGSVIAMVTSHRSPGYLGSSRLILQDIKTNRRLDVIDTDAQPVYFMPDGSLIYVRYIDQPQALLAGEFSNKFQPCISELCRYAVGEKTRVIGAWTRSFGRPADRRWIGDYLNAEILRERNQAVIEPDYHSGNLLVDLETGKVARLAATGSMSLSWCNKERALFQQVYYVKSQDSAVRNFVEVTRAGEVIPQTWIPSGTVFLDFEAEKPLVWIQEKGPYDKAAQKYTYMKDTFAKLDFETRTLKVLAEYSDTYLHSSCSPKPSDKYLIFNGEKGTFRFDREAGTLKPFPLPIGYIKQMSSLGNNHVLADSRNHELWNIDLAIGEAKKL
ncbi:MAG: hypothetical protein WA705_04165 [Candidatus Ozemobacteraceae bacterium]